MLSHYLAPRVPSPSLAPAFPTRNDLGLRGGPGSPVPFDEEARLGGATTGLWDLVPWKIKREQELSPEKGSSINRNSRLRDHYSIEPVR